MTLLRTKGISRTLGGQQLFDKLDVDIEPGDVVLLRGPNGSGKSTFLRALSGQQPVDEGVIDISGKLLGAWSPLERELLAPIVDQDPVLNWDISTVDNLVDRLTVGPSLLNWLLTTRTQTRRRICEEYSELVEAFGLTEKLRQRTGEFNFGHQRLLTLLRALRPWPKDEGKPRVLLLDEPLDSLSRETVQTVLEIINDRLQSGWAVVVASHLPEIEQLKPNKTLTFPAVPKDDEPAPQLRKMLKKRMEILSGGERAVVALAVGLINQPDVLFLDEPAANLDTKASDRLKRILRRYVDVRNAGCVVIEHRLSFDGFFDETIHLDTHGIANPEVPRPDSSARMEDADTIIELTDGAASYSPDWKVVQNINLQVRGRQITGIVGPNAAGKTTLFRALFNHGAELEGSLVWRQSPVENLRAKSVPSASVAWVPQDRPIYRRMTVEEVLFGSLSCPEFNGILAGIKDLVGVNRHARRARLEGICRQIDDEA